MPAIDSAAHDRQGYAVSTALGPQKNPIALANSRETIEVGCRSLSYGMYLNKNNNKKQNPAARISTSTAGNVRLDPSIVFQHIYYLFSTAGPYGCTPSHAQKRRQAVQPTLMD